MGDKMYTLRRLSLPIDIFVLLFALSGVLGIFPSYDRALGYPMLAAILLSVLLYFGAAYFIRSWELARNLSLGLLLVGTAFALLFIGQYGYQDYIEMPGVIQRLGALTTLLPEVSSYDLHPNAAATFLEGLLPLGIVLAITSRERWQQAVWALCTLVMAYALLLSFSRGALLALLGTLAIFLITRLPRWYALIAGAVIALLLVIALLVLPQHVAIVGDSVAWISDRLALYRNSMYVASDYAFTGIGLGDTFSLIYSRYGLLIQVPFLTYTHNLPLATWMNQGLPGLIAFTGVVVTFYLFIYRVNRSSTPRRLFHGLWLGVTATLLHGLFDARQYIEGWWMMGLLFLLLGLAVALGRVTLQKAFWESREVKLTYFPRIVPVTVAVALVALMVIFNRPLLAAWNTNMGALTETRGELTPNLTNDQRTEFYIAAQQWYENALATDSSLANPNRRLGNLDVKLEQFEEAIAPLEAAFGREPQNPAAIKGLGLAYAWVGETGKAAETLRLLDDTAQMTDELYTWGRYRQEQGKTLLAAYAWDTAQTLTPNSTNLDVLMLIGNTYLEAGEVDKAQHWYQQVLEADPDYEAATAALAALG